MRLIDEKRNEKKGPMRLIIEKKVFKETGEKDKKRMMTMLMIEKKNISRCKQMNIEKKGKPSIWLEGC